ncbi:MAG: hypothetical protein N6V41_01680, partial [Candidatus Portiera aleyrodidarum]|nr:hypothetical protein [Candidatus Portiera aleyrodidarum]
SISNSLTAFGGDEQVNYHSRTSKESQQQQQQQQQQLEALPKSILSARLSFWSNFISALNCSRTQTIIPT